MYSEENTTRYGTIFRVHLSLYHRVYFLMAVINKSLSIEVMNMSPWHLFPLTTHVLAEAPQLADYIPVLGLPPRHNPHVLSHRIDFLPSYSMMPKI